MDRRNMLPDGTRDLILDECEIKRSLERSIDSLFESWGFNEVITPTVEYYETFNDETQSLKEEDMYKFFDSRGRILVLRPDMTIPIARVVETKLKDAQMPLKLRYMSNVFRVHESFGGRRNEFTDCGVELIGLEDKKSDLEILVLALEAVRKLGLEDYKLEIGNIGFLKGILNDLDITENQKRSIAQFIEDKNLKSLGDYLDSLNMDENSKEFLNKVPWMFGNESVLKEAEKYAFSESILSNIKYLETLSSQLAELGYGDEVTFDLGMAPRLNYYTGIIFRGFSEGIGNTFLRGGRYDKLIKSRNGTYMNSVGFSIDVNSVIPIVKEKHHEFEKKQKCIIYYNELNNVEAVRKSVELRKRGVIADLIPDEKVNEVMIVKSEVK